MGKYLKMLRKDLQKLRINDIYYQRSVMIFGLVMAGVVLQPTMHFIGIAVATKLLMLFGFV